MERVPPTLQLYCAGCLTESRQSVGKFLVIVIFLSILASLGSALWFLMKDREGSERLAKTLTLRIGLSIGLFCLLYVLYLAGLITPHGVQP